MAKRKRTIADLTVKELVTAGVSMSYAYDLLKGNRTPSLPVALRLEDRFGIPARAWLRPCDAGRFNPEGEAA